MRVARAAAPVVSTRRLDVIAVGDASSVEERGQLIGLITHNLAAPHTQGLLLRRCGLQGTGLSPPAVDAGCGCARFERRTSACRYLVAGWTCFLSERLAYAPSFARSRRGWTVSSTTQKLWRRPRRRHKMRRRHQPQTGNHTGEALAVIGKLVLILEVWTRRYLEVGVNMASSMAAAAAAAAQYCWIPVVNHEKELRSLATRGR